MKKNLLAFLLIAISFFLSCKSTYSIKATGDQVSIELKSKGELFAELLSVQEQRLFIKKDGQLFTIPFNQIAKLEIKEAYEARERKVVYSVLGTINIVAVPLIIGARGAGAASIGFGVVSFVAIGTSPLKFKLPLSMERLQRLKLHSNYPLGLTDEQKQALLLYYGQDKFRTISR